MKHGPGDDDPTIEEESLEYDGTATEPLGETYGLRVRTTSENSSGTVGHDDRGQARWQWVTEFDGAPREVEDTFNHLKALDNPALSLEPEEAEADAPSQAGYDPYATGVFKRPKLARPRRG